MLVHGHEQEHLVNDLCTKIIQITPSEGFKPLGIFFRKGISSHIITKTALASTHHTGHLSEHPPNELTLWSFFPS